MLEQFLSQVNIVDIQLRLAIVTLVIIVNLILSVMESIKLKTFSFKKLPDFILNWMMGCASVVFIEIIISLIGESPIVKTVMVSIREIMLLSIIGCYLKKILESLKTLGWNVNTDKIINFVDNKKNDI